jgi:predicted nucleic acid-binding Zn ribbon protein
MKRVLLVGYDPKTVDYSDPAIPPGMTAEKIEPAIQVALRQMADRGWEATAADAAVLARWDALVGAEIAAHCHPVSLRDGELTLAAESTAWATQLRLLAPRMLARIRAELGPEVVSRVRVHGPTAPSWRAGPRRVAGRGPRDTYG